MQDIRKMHFTVCINKSEHNESAPGKLAMALRAIEIRKQYPNSYVAIKNVYESDTITIGNTHIIRRAA